MYLDNADLTDDSRSIRLEPCFRGLRMLPAARALREARRFSGCSEKQKLSRFEILVYFQFFFNYPPYSGIAS